jgi:hypothetical protein
MKYVLLICGDGQAWVEAEQRYGEVVRLAHRVLLTFSTWLPILCGP